MKIRLGLSPEVDDAFLFHGLLNGLVDTGELEIEPVIETFQTLNDLASRGQLEATVMSVHAYAYAQSRYNLSRHGATFGTRGGPMLLARDLLTADELSDSIVAVASVTSSAYLAMSIWNPMIHTRVVPFDKVIPAVESGLASAGLVSPELQMELEWSGLQCVMDLGLWWAGETTGLPLPLGCFVIRKDMADGVAVKLNALVAQSAQYAMDNRAAVVKHLQTNRPEVSAELIDEFIGDYVTGRSFKLDDEGEKAIGEFLARGHAAGVIPETNVAFVD
jgi:1,4-dihydroxy-6-naphthoate synthase